MPAVPCRVMLDGKLPSKDSYVTEVACWCRIAAVSPVMLRFWLYVLFVPEKAVIASLGLKYLD